MTRRRRPVVPQQLCEQIDEALGTVDDARADLARVVADRAPLAERRQAHAKVTRAFAGADALLRQATTLARQQSYREWSLWRHRLSSLDAARQVQLFAELDEPCLLPIGSIRAVDTGMSGPDIGELQHGQLRPPGALPTYGLDLEASLLATADSTIADVGPDPIVEPLEPRLVVDARTAGPAPTPRQAA